MSQIILIDGSSWLYRAFHALPRLTSPDGQPTGAIYGMGNMLRKLLKEYDPQHIAVVFDPRGKTFRHDMYAEYKANRPPVPPELSDQFDPLCELVDLLGLPRVQISGVEADDVIATLAQQALAQDHEVLVVSGDKDLAQLVNDKLHLLDTMKGITYDPAGIEEKYAVRPDQIIDWLALMGDSSDNVPGVPSVGAKTAAKWLAVYDSLDEIVAHADEIKGKIGEKLRAHLDQLSLSRDLVTVKLDVELSTQIDELTRQELDAPGLAEFSRRYGFTRWLDQFEEQGKKLPQPEQGEIAVETVLTSVQLQALLSQLEKAKVFAVDTETDQLDPQQARLVGLSFAISADKAWYVPVAHDYLGAPAQLPVDEVRKVLGPILADISKPKIAQHGKYDMHILRRHDMPLRGVQWDTMLESYVLNATASRHDMDSLAQHYLNRKTISFKEIAGIGKKQLTFNQIDIEQAAEYAGEDAAVTFALDQAIGNELRSNPALLKVYTELEQPLISVLAAIEARGVLLNRNLLAKASSEFAERMATMQARSHEIAGKPFNLNSPTQLKDILFDDLELPVLRKTPKGAPSTAEDVLQELASQHELPQLILDWRGLAKLRSTYTEKLPANINPYTGRVHTSYHQAVATTGRLSSADPNLQNIPIRNDDGRRIRQAFVAEPGYRVVALDYSQIELRLMAHMSADPGMISAFQSGADIHKRTAAEVFEIPLDQVDSDHRRAAKAINFGLIYGISAFGLARNLGIGRQLAQSHMDRFFDRYPDVAKYMQKCKDQAAQCGYVETLFGRRLYLPDINDRNGTRRQAAERVAINAPLQGTAADIIKLAMIRIHENIADNNDVQMIMQVHDELVFEIRQNIVEQQIVLLKAAMENVVELSVPLQVDGSEGDNWDQAHG
ncbi:MAG: DNA polymerase I [Oceanococcus sp.]